MLWWTLSVSNILLVVFPLCCIISGPPHGHHPMSRRWDRLGVTTPECFFPLALLKIPALIPLHNHYQLHAY